MTVLVIPVGCASNTSRNNTSRVLDEQPRIIAVAPVINLSGASDVDTIRLTDWLAAEVLAFRGIGVVPVNLTLATLNELGIDGVASPAEAYALADALGADAALVTALTDYDPYHPPRVGIIMQWYQRDSANRMPSGTDPVSASRQASDRSAIAQQVELAPPLVQIQRVYDADHQLTLSEVRQYADQRGGAQSVYGWRRYTQSQELFTRYCFWSAFGSMLTVQQQYRTQPAAPANVREDDVQRGDVQRGDVQRNDVEESMSSNTNKL